MISFNGFRKEGNEKTIRLFIEWVDSNTFFSISQLGGCESSGTPFWASQSKFETGIRFEELGDNILVFLLMDRTCGIGKGSNIRECCNFIQNFQLEFSQCYDSLLHLFVCSIEHGLRSLFKRESLRFAIFF